MKRFLWKATVFGISAALVAHSFSATVVDAATIDKRQEYPIALDLKRLRQIPTLFIKDVKGGFEILTSLLYKEEEQTAALLPATNPPKIAVIPSSSPTLSPKLTPTPVPSLKPKSSPVPTKAPIKAPTIIQGVSQSSLTSQLKALENSFNLKLKSLPPPLVTSNVSEDVLNNIYRSIGLAAQSAPAQYSVISNPTLTNPSISGNLSVSGNVTASAFYGDGSHLTGISSGGISTSSLNNLDPIKVGFSNISSGTSTSVFGWCNIASGEFSQALGGKNCACSTTSGSYGTYFGAVAVGFCNNATASGYYGAGSSALGICNTASGYYSSALGMCNTASGNCSSASGYHNTALYRKTSAFGYGNTASCCHSSAFGTCNTSGGTSSSAFGYFNVATGNQSSAFGNSTSASGHYSSAFGFALCVSATGASVFGGDSSGAVLTNSVACSTLIGPRTAAAISIVSGGQIGIRGTAASTTAAIIDSSGAILSTGGTWVNASDRNLKENFTDLDSSEILSKINSLPIQRWNYKAENQAVTHIGPVAQDFYSTFGLGGSDTSISTIDPAGVALIGIQVLSKEQASTTKAIENLNFRLNEISPLALSGDNLFVGWLKSFGASIVDGVMHFGEVVVRKFKATEEICINETCINEDQLKAWINSNPPISSPATILSPTPVLTPTPTLIPSPTPDLVPTSSPVPTLEPTPRPTPEIIAPPISDEPVTNISTESSGIE